MAEFRKVAHWSQLEERKIKAVEINGTLIALYKIDGQVFATSEACSHEGCSLEEFGEISADEIECTCHGARFKIKTGETTRLPALKALTIYPAKVEADDVLVEI